MIINKDRNPVFSLYYLGAVILKNLSSEKIFTIDELYEEIKEQVCDRYHIKISINFFYYALDWLYIQSLIELNNEGINYVNRGINTTKNSFQGPNY